MTNDQAIGQRLYAACENEPREDVLIALAMVSACFIKSEEEKTRFHTFVGWLTEEGARVN